MRASSVARSPRPTAIALGRALAGVASTLDAWRTASIVGLRAGAGGRVFGLLPLLAVAMLSGCGGSSHPSTPAGPSAALIVTYPPRLGLAVGGSATLAAQPLDASGAPISATVTWQSSDPTIVSVTGATVTAVAKGTANLTASVDSVASTPVPVSVSDPGTASQKIQAALAAGLIDATTALRYRLYANYVDPRLPIEYLGNQPQGNDDTTGIELALEYGTLSAADQADLGPYFLPPIYADSWWTPRTARVAGTGTPTLAVVPPPTLHAMQRPTRHAGGRPGLCSGVLNPGWASIDTLHFRVWYNASVGPNDATYAANVSVAAEKAIALLVGGGLLGMRAPLPDDATGPCNGGDGRLDVYMVGPESMASQGAFAVTTPITETDVYSVFILVNRDKFAEPGVTPGSAESTVYHEFMHAVQAAYRNNAIGAGTLIAEATAEWFSENSQPTLAPSHYYAPGFQADSAVPLSSTLADGPDDHKYGAYLFFQFVTKATDTSGVGYGGPDVVRALFEALDGAVASTIQTSGPNDTRLAILDSVLPRGLTQTFADYSVAAWNTAPYTTFKTIDQLTIPAHTNKTTAVTIAPTGGTRVDLTPQDAFGIDLKINELSARYDRFTFDNTVSTVTFFNGYTDALQERAAPLLDNSMTPTTTGNGLGTTWFAFPPTTQERGKRYLTALFRVGTNWTREDWTDTPFRPFCRDTAAEHIDELVVIYTNAEFTDIRDQSGIPDNALGALSVPAAGAPTVGGAPSRVVSTNMPCYQLQGTAQGSVHVTEAGSDFTVNTKMTAVFRGIATPGQGTLYGRTVAELPGWRFAAISGSISATLNGVVASCSPGRLNLTGTPVAVSALTAPPDFTLLTNYSPASPASLAYAGSSTTAYFQMNPGVECTLGQTIYSPAPFNYNFNALWGGANGDAFFYVDRPSRLLQQTGIDTPLYYTGSFGAATRGTTSWCLVASNEGASPPAGVCP